MNSVPPPLPQAPPPGWWARNWKWSVPVLAVTLIACFAGFLFLIFTTVFGFMKSSEPYKEAMARASNNPQIQDALGTPVTDGFMMTGNISTAGSSGRASLEIPITGPKGKAFIHVEASKSGGTWTYTTLEAAIPGQATPVLLK